MLTFEVGDAYGVPKGGGLEGISMQVEPYVFFSGTCEAALAFYASVFGGEVSEVMRYGAAPPNSDHPNPPGWENKIMHSVFKAPGISMMASDASTAEPGPDKGRVALSIGLSDANEGKRLFDALAVGGTITQPWGKQFWGASFGMLTDQFGVDWLINAGG